MTTSTSNTSKIIHGAAIGAATFCATSSRSSTQRPQDFTIAAIAAATSFVVPQEYQYLSRGAASLSVGYLATQMFPQDNPLSTAGVFILASTVSAFGLNQLGQTIAETWTNENSTLHVSIRREVTERVIEGDTQEVENFLRQNQIRQNDIAHQQQNFANQRAQAAHINRAANPFQPLQQQGR